VACGNGRLLHFLAAEGWRGNYLGVDGSSRLLAEAQRAAPQGTGRWVAFRQVDLVSADWPAAASFPSGEWPDAITALAVLHHIPGKAHRMTFLQRCAGLLPAGGTLVVSTWQFMDAPRLRSRILPWETAGLDAEALEPGDHLLSWGQGAAGLRYCAAIDEPALRALAGRAELAPVAFFSADGLEGNLNLYGVFRKSV
jgi:2-polyprenyl-3-methyl-5-hydroxy-6-metoxy-1,4-benzoquinol methylase